MPSILKEERHTYLLKQHLGFGNNTKLIKSESPDFILRTDNKIIGIEHTELFLERQYPLQAKESIEDAVSSVAQSYADSVEYIPARAKILYGNTQGLKKKQRAKLARKIADHVQVNLLQSDKQAFTQVRLTPDINEVNTIYATIMPEGFKNHYFATRAGWVKRDATDEVYSALQKKAPRVGHYLTKCDEIWLLTVADGSNPSSLLGRDEGVNNIPSLHGFNKVYFMYYQDKVIYEVKATNKS